MIDRMFYWLGGKACSTIGIVSELMTSDSGCTRRQTWSLGAVLLSTLVAFLIFSVVRRRR